MWGRIFSGLVLLLLGDPAPAAAVQGLPLIQRFTARDHQSSATSVAVLTAPGGLTFIGNDRGLLRFDGAHWDRLELPGRGAARALAHGPDGSIYVGGYDRFGRAEIDATGAMRFVDLGTELRPGADDPPFGQVWAICNTDAGTYVFSDAVLAFLGRAGERQRWPMNGDNRAPFCTEQGIYSRVQGQGLSILEDGGYRTLGDGALFADSPLYQVFETGHGVLAIGDAGFYRINGDRLLLLPDTDGERFADYPPYAGLQLSDGSLMFGTYAGELLHFSSALRLLTAQAVTPYTIYEMAQDDEGGLWAATEGELLRLQVPSAWSIYTAELGLVGQAYDTAVHAGELYVATSLGVLRARPAHGTGRLEPAIATSLEASALEPDPAGMLVADRVGILVYRADHSAPQRLLESDAPAALLRSRIDPRRVYAPATAALDVLQSSEGRWQHLARVPLGTQSVAGVEEASDGSLWIGDSRGGPLRLRIEDAGRVLERTTFGAEHGLLIDPLFGCFVARLDGDIYVISGRQVARYADGRFTSVDQPPFNLFPDPFEMAISETPAGAFAYSPGKLLHRAEPGGRWQPMLGGTALSGGYSNPHLDHDGRIRMGVWDGVLQYDPQRVDPELPELAVRMRSVSLRVGDAEPIRLPLDTGNRIQRFPAGALVQIDFGLPTSEPGAQFRLRIAGMFDEFSSWGPVVSPALNLRAPGPGDYRLEVQGRTPSGRTAQPLTYRFRVEPHWWQTPLARVAGGVLLMIATLGIAALGLRWRVRRHVETNRALEQRIAERTAELEAANRKLAELATEDQLTGIANRRALEQALRREWGRCLETGQLLAVVMIDVDHFKRFNDRHGHLAGDQHLVRVARLLGEHVRPVRELLARFGGEEFVIVLPGSDREAAAGRAEAIRAAVAAALPGTSISAGVAAEVPRADGEGPLAILRRADVALYRAKKSGRNRVAVEE